MKCQPMIWLKEELYLDISNLKKKNYHNLILSSSSLARKELLNKFGLSYKSFYPNVNESPLIDHFIEQMKNLRPI